MNTKTDKEKAIAYDEVLGRAKSLVDFCSDNELKILKFVFPELKENEDERIRNVLIGWINLESSISFGDTFDGFSKEQILAWLEKQCEKPQGKSALDAINEENVDNQNCVKPSVKGEPKFKVGDWCIDNEDGIVFQIVKVLDKTYRYRTNEGKEYSCARYSLELDARFWTIKDANEGDVLVDSLGNVCIYQEPSTKLMYHSHCYGNHKYFIYMGGSHEIVGSYPATKEQRDQLEKAMDDAGYTFDFEKKKLKKLKFKVGDEVITENERSLTITKIDEEGYWSNDLFICDFDNECNWNLVEQKPDDKVEPKFKVGDWIVNNDNDCIYQIKSIKDYEYCLWSLDSNVEGFLRIANVDNNFHLWDITKDAKKGDVLVHNGCTFIFMGIENGIVQAYEKNLLYGKRTCNFGEPDNDNDYSPAAEEQRDLLCQKMKEADYEFDFDKKVLKKIEQKPPIVNFKARDWDVSKVDGKIYNAKFMEEPLTNQKRRLEIEKAAMSATGIIEQEEWFIKGAEWSDKNSSYISSENQGEQKSFDYENANIPQKDSTWGEEDKHWVQKVIDFMNHPDLIKATPTLAKDTINWLKSLKDRVQPQSKQEWSEEDESNIQGIIEELRVNRYHAPHCDLPTYDRFLSWFKSLKNRYGWKPSDEQIKALEHFVRSIGESGFASPYDDNTRLLYSLLEQLKKI